MGEILAEMKQKRGTAAVLTAANPVLREGEICVETDTGRIKLGNGTDAWNDLPYASGSSGMSGAAFTIPGDASTTSWAFTHGFGTLHVAHEIYDSSGATVEAEFTRTDANNVTVASGVPLGEGNDLTLLVWPVA
jgi:hypothetical protein